LLRKKGVEIQLTQEKKLFGLKCSLSPQFRLGAI